MCSVPERTDSIPTSVIFSCDLYKSKLVLLFLFKIRIRFIWLFFETKSTDLLEITVQEAQKVMYLLNLLSTLFIRNQKLSSARLRERRLTREYADSVLLPFASASAENCRSDDLAPFWVLRVTARQTPAALLRSTKVCYVEDCSVTKWDFVY